MLSQIKHYIFDMDGVLWHGDTALPNLPELFETLRRLQIPHVFATNNASKTPDEYVAKFGRMGVPIHPHQVMTSALATAHHLARNHDPNNTKIYMIGKIGLRQALENKGFHVLDRADYKTPAQIVVVGFNQSSIYEDFACATIHIRQHGAKFVGCNPDVTFPSERGLVPGNGSQLALITAATDQEPEIIGKPYPTMFYTALDMLGPQASGNNTLMVGDRLNTDIAGAATADIKTLLVLSGITQPADLAASSLQPDIVMANITELLQKIKALHNL